MGKKRRIRVVLTKSGLDGHSRGIKVMSKGVTCIFGPGTTIKEIADHIRSSVKT